MILGMFVITPSPKEARESPFRYYRVGEAAMTDFEFKVQNDFGKGVL